MANYAKLATGEVVEVIESDGESHTVRNLFDTVRYTIEEARIVRRLTEAEIF